MEKVSSLQNKGIKSNIKQGIFFPLYCSPKSHILMSIISVEETGVSLWSVMQSIAKWKAYILSK